MADQRRAINYIRTAGLSKGYYLHVFGAGMTFMAILSVYAFKWISAVSTLTAAITTPELAASLHDQILTAFLLFFVCFLAFILAASFYILVLSHRVGGPIVAIVHYINELKRGNFEARRELRKNDELMPIMDELKDLAQVLKSQG